MDGLEACRRIMQRNPLRNISIIVLTAKPAPEDLRTAFHTGAMDSICKPIDPVELAACVSSALALNNNKRECQKAPDRELFGRCGR